jgi:hypothetical protein
MKIERAGDLVGVESGTAALGDGSRKSGRLPRRPTLF